MLTKTDRRTEGQTQPLLLAHVYHGLHPILTVTPLPPFLPHLCYRRRDRANAEMKAIFTQVIKKRRQGRGEGEGEGEEGEEDDLLQRLLESRYK